MTPFQSFGLTGYDRPRSRADLLEEAAQGNLSPEDSAALLTLVDLDSAAPWPGATTAQARLESLGAQPAARMGAAPQVAPAATPRMAPLSLAAIEQAQAEGARNAALNRAGVGFDDAAKLIAGVQQGTVRPDASLRDAPLQSLQQRQAMAQDATERARQERLKDPTSPESRAAQRSAATFAAGLVSPEALEGMSAADIERALPLFQVQARLRADEARIEVEQQRLRQQAEIEEYRRKAEAGDKDAERKLKQLLAEMEIASEERIARLRGQRSGDAGGAKAAAAEQRRIDEDVNKFGDAVIKLGAGGFYSNYTNLESLLSRYPNDIPGVGRLDGNKPIEALSADGIAVRQGIGKMLAAYINAISGAGVSDAERKNLEAVTGLVKSGDERQVREGLRQMKGNMDYLVRLTAARFNPRAVAEYGSRVPEIGATVGSMQQAAPPQPVSREALASRIAQIKATLPPNLAPEEVTSRVRAQLKQEGLIQ